MWIMIAGPYRSGTTTDDERDANLRTLNLAAGEVFRRGHTPIIGVNMALPVIEAAGMNSYDEMMMPISTALAERCDAILRIGGPSSGADEEVERVRARGGEVFTDIDDIPFANQTK